MLIRYIITYKSDPETKGGGISISAETADFHVESTELLASFKAFMDKSLTLKDAGGKKIEGLYIQSVDYSDRERPSGVISYPKEFQ